MSDDLVKRYSSYNIMMLGDSGNKVSTPDGEWVKYKDYKAQADRIEELEDELAEYKHVASAVDNQWALSQDEIADLKAELVKAKEAIECVNLYIEHISRHRHRRTDRRQG